MPTREEIIQSISTSLEDLGQNPSVKLYLVVKTKNDEEPFVFYAIHIDGNVPGYFHSTLEKKLHAVSEDIKKSPAKFKSFFSVLRDVGDIFYVPAEDVPNFKWILDKLAQKPQKIDSFPNLNKLGDIWGFAVDMETQHGKTIYFRKYTESKIIGKENEKGKWSGRLHEGKLTDLQGDVLTFDEQIDCIYFGQTDTVVVTSQYGRFETMFDFRDYYKKETKKALGELKDHFLIIEDDLIQKAAGRIRTSQNITKLSRSGVFKDIKDKKITASYFKDTRDEFGADISYTLLGEKLVLDNVKDVDAFADVCSFKYLKGSAGLKKGDSPLLFTSDYKDIYQKK